MAIHRLRRGPCADRHLTYPLKDNVNLRVGTIEWRVPFAVGAEDDLPAEDYQTLAVLFAFEGEFVPDGKLKTQPRIIMAGEGGIVTAPSVFVAGKFENGWSFWKP